MLAQDPRATLSFVSNHARDIHGALKGVLKIDIGYQRALDVIAVCHNYRSHNSLKGLAGKGSYSIQVNLGSEEKPFIIDRPLGVCASSSEALSAAERELADCQAFLSWRLMRNGQSLGIKVETAPRPQSGVVYQIEVAGKTIGDVEFALDEMTDRIDNQCGFDSNETGSFSFVRAGEEVSDEESEGPMDDGDLYYNLTEAKELAEAHDLSLFLCEVGAFDPDDDPRTAFATYEIAIAADNKLEAGESAAHYAKQTFPTAGNVIFAKLEVSGYYG